MSRLFALLVVGLERWRSDEPDRGDVPGWVMIVVMTAALVAALLAVVGPRLTDVFNRAIDSVSR